MGHSKWYSACNPDAQALVYKIMLLPGINYPIQEQFRINQQVFDKIAERLSASRQLFAQIKVIQH
jgi:hypothetical protein